MIEIEVHGSIASTRLANQTTRSKNQSCTRPKEFPSGTFHLAAAGDDGVVRIFPPNGMPVTAPKVDRPVRGLDWNPAGDTLAGVADDGRVWLWNAQGQLDKTLRAPGSG